MVEGETTGKDRTVFAAPPFINLIVLRSPDIDRAAEFYETVGMAFIKHRHGDGPEHCSYECNGFVFEIYPLGDATPTTSTRIGFSVDDVESIVEMLAEVGGNVVSSPHDSDWGRRAVMNDLDGHTVELITPPNLGLHANGRSGDVSIDLDRSLSEPARWSLQIDLPQLYLDFAVDGPKVLGELKSFLESRWKNASSGELELGSLSNGNVTLIKDDEFEDRFFLCVFSSNGTVRYTIDPNLISDLTSALNDAIQDV